MLQTAIIGGGLCGLKLAKDLRAKGRDCVVFEARDRLGGRILSVPSEVSGLALDLGPSWFWPETQPRISRLLDELGLHHFPQHDTGKVLGLVDHDKAPDTLDRPNLHGGAHRIEGGTAALVHALSRDLAAGVVRFGHVLTAVIDRSDHVALHFRCGAESSEILARRVVLAMPPRLVEEQVVFDPPLDGQLREALRETHTWMADQAKAMVAYARPFWRAAGHSGNAFVHHEHVVLGEIFDACSAAGDKAALGGFFALPPDLRASLRGGLPMLVSSQLVQVFGIDAEHGEQHLQDWASEPYTCSQRDRTPPDHHPEYGHPALRWPQWGGKLHFGGSETASYGGGYLEGALEAAARLQRMLTHTEAVMRPKTGGSGASNEASLAQFSAWVDAQRNAVIERYRRHLHQRLANQLKEQVTQRAVLATVEQVYSEALVVLEELPFETSAAGAVDGRAELTPRLLEAFVGFNKAMLDQILLFNRSSCALSNFPDEHVIAPAYLETIARDLMAAWQEFARGVNALLVARTQPAPGVATAA